MKKPTKKPAKKLVKKARPKEHKIQTDYLGNVYGKQFLKVVPAAIKALKAFKKKHPFEAIAFTGSSGAALAFPISYLLKVPLIHVRKKDKNHYGEAIEGTVSAKKYVIVDDFVATGATIKRILKTIEDELGKEVKPVGLCLYASYDTRTTYNSPRGPLPVIKVSI